MLILGELELYGDPHDAATAIGWLRDRLVALIEEDDRVKCYWAGGDCQTCVHCRKILWYPPEPDAHEPNCPVVLGRAVLKALAAAWPPTTNPTEEP